jgi:hypothetical protein
MFSVMTAITKDVFEIEVRHSQLTSGAFTSSGGFTSTLSLPGSISKKVHSPIRKFSITRKNPYVTARDVRTI